jgi:IS30 family transposase
MEGKSIFRRDAGVGGSVACPCLAKIKLQRSRQIRKLPANLRRSLTWDRGLEMAKHKTFTVATDVKVYFCDPQSPLATRLE